MKPARHLFALVLLCLASLSHAAFPDRPIKMRVGFPAGGPLDAQAGLLAERLGQVRIRPVIIDCKAGAGGTVGAEFVARSSPDGYTLLTPTPARW